MKKILLIVTALTLTTSTALFASESDVSKINTQENKVVAELEKDENAVKDFSELPFTKLSSSEMDEVEGGGVSCGYTNGHLTICKQFRH